MGNLLSLIINYNHHHLRSVSLAGSCLTGNSGKSMQPASLFSTAGKYFIPS